MSQKSRGKTNTFHVILTHNLLSVTNSTNSFTGIQSTTSITQYFTTLGYNYKYLQRKWRDVEFFFLVGGGWNIFVYDFMFQLHWLPVRYKWLFEMCSNITEIPDTVWLINTAVTLALLWLERSDEICSLKSPAITRNGCFENRLNNSWHIPKTKN